MFRQILNSADFFRSKKSISTRNVLAAFFAAALLFSCNTDIRYPTGTLDKGTGNDGDGENNGTAMPTLTALYFENAEAASNKKRAGAESGTSVLQLLSVQTGESTDFDPKTTAYKVRVPAPAFAVTLTVKAADGLVITNNGERPFTPQPGTMTLVSVSDSKGNSTSYTIFYEGETAVDPLLETAILTSVLLSSGNAGQIDADGNFDNGTHARNVDIPYGVTEVSVWAQGEDGAFVAYDKLMPVSLSGGEKILTILVSKPGKNVGAYILTFKPEASGIPSRLLDVIPSPGYIAIDAAHLNEPGAFNPDAADGEIQQITVASDMLYAAGNQIAITVQKPAEFPFSVVTFRRNGAEFNGLLTGVTNGDAFTITVNNGAGYMDKTYNFVVNVLLIPASIDDNANIVLTPVTGAAFKKRGADGVSGTDGFDKAVTAYNLEFTSAVTSVTLTATPPDFGTVVISGDGAQADAPNNGKEITITSLSGSNNPIIFTFNKSGKLPAVYTVFFVRTDKIDAKLNAMFSFANCTINGFNPNDYKNTLSPYIIDVPSNVTALIPVNAIGDPATLAVDYSLVSNPVDGFSFGITVGDGDVDYNTKTYYFRVNKLAAQIPCLTALTVMVRSIDFLNPNFDRVRFAYDAVIPATATETEAVVSWDYDPSVVQSVFTAVDGSAWALETGYGITLTGLTPGASKLVRIKARTFEGNEAEYTITVSHAVSTAAQLVNIRKWMITSWVQISNFAPGTYYYAEPVGSQNITLEITPPTDGTWQASVDGVTTIGESSSIGTFEVQDLAVGIPKIVIITSKAQDGVSTAIYTVVLTRNGDTTTQLLNIQVGGTAGKTAFDSGLFQSDRFNYAVTLGYSNSGTVILTPTLAGGVIDTAYLHVYTIINGLEAAASTTSANLTPIENSQDIVVFQVRNKDTGQPSVVYTVIVSKKGNTDNKLKALSVRKNEESGDELKGSIAPSLGSTAAQEEEKLASDYNYTLYLSNDTDRVYITPSAAATSEIWYSITNGGAITAYTRFSGASFGVIDITPDSNVVVAIQVRPQDASAGWSVYTLVLRKTVISYLYTYTSPAPYTWTAPLAGIYNFELWGAQGGRGLNTIPDNGGAAGGTGGYIKAKKTLSAGSVLYLYPGQQGNGPSTTSDRNGGAQVYGGGGAGGKSTHQTIFAGGGSGGGATFVSTVYNTGTVYASAPISDTDVRVNFALIAGGGGGTSNGQVGGRGSGTDTGGSAYSKSGSIISGATSSVGSGNGIGQTGRVGNSGSGGDHGAGGGGGGYYGGLAQQASGSNTDAGGSGGNGYINTASGWMLLDTDRVGNTGAGDFKNIPKPSDAGTEAGHSGAGFIRITYMGQ